MFKTRNLAFFFVTIVSLSFSAFLDAQVIEGRIDTFHEGLFSLSNSGSTQNTDSITSSSSDYFDTREVEVVPGASGVITADLDPIISPSIFVTSFDANFDSGYTNADGSTANLLANGEDGFLLRLEEFEIGETVVIVAQNPGYAEFEYVTITGPDVLVAYSQFVGVDWTNVDRVAFSIEDSGGSTGTYVAEGFYTVSSVPEPAAGTILFAGSSLLFFWRRKRR